MSRIVTTLALACVLLALAGTAQAQTFGPTGIGYIAVNVGPEASIRIDTTTATLTSGGNFANYTGSTAFTYKIRTSSSSGTGAITLAVSSDFSPAGGPSVYTPPTAGDTLAYTCTLASPGTACSGSLTSGAAATSVGTFGANARSALAGNTGSVAWTLINDPTYIVGSYTATVTYTISAT